MKQKYVIRKDDEKNTLTLQEYAELDKDSLSLLCEQHYDGPLVLASIESGKDALINLLRTKNLYPPALYMNQIADSVMSAYQPSGPSLSEVLFDDANFLTKGNEIPELVEVEEEPSDIEDLIDDADEIEEEFADDEDISNIGTNSTLKIADDESLDIEDDV